jgi:DNA-binding transcriptional MerR regulator
MPKDAGPGERESRLGVAELADLGGVSRRTVRFYVHEGLLPEPLGLGRGRHYGAEHLERLLEVKALQERGHSLADIRAALSRGSRGARLLERPQGPPPTRTTWVRLEILPGVELSVSNAYRVPAPGRIAELAEWCRAHLRRHEEE